VNRQIAALGVGLVLAGVLSWCIWWALGIPVSVPDAPPGKVHCVSYTPFRGSETPFDPLYLADPRRIETDLRLVSEFSNCIRLYAPDQGLAAAIPIAGAYGMKVLLGIWIGRDPVANRNQVAIGVSLAQAFKDSIKAVIVGNEVLLRGEQTAHAMAELAKRVKSETGLPVTYADVTDFWLTAPRELADSVDFITIHILPYWEDRPTSAGRGVEVVKSAVARVHALFPDKPIYIGETGFPSAGRERETAIPSLVSQARYLRGFMRYAEETGHDYNLIEAFDQPWKRLLEGTAGGYWGIYDSARAPKFSWRGPVSNYPGWRRAAEASLAVSFALLLGWFATGTAASLRRAMFLGIAAGLGGVLLVLQTEHSWAAWRSPLELAIEAMVLLQSLAALFVLPPEMANGRAAHAPAPLSHCLAFLRAPRSVPFDRALGLGLLRLAGAVFALIASLCLAFDPRYRDFPDAAFAVAAIGFAWIALARGEAFRPALARYEESVLAVLFLAATAIIVINETPLNLEADLWCALNLLMVLPWIGALRGTWQERFMLPYQRPGAKRSG